MTHPKVLVLDGDARAALAVTRSLGQRGYPVLVGEKHAPSLAQTSRYCSGRVLYPDPAHDETAFLSALERAIRDHAVQVLLPITDISTMLVARHRETFAPLCDIPIADACTLDHAADKLHVLRRAQQLGVPVPQTWVLESAAQPIPEDLTFPAVLKPHRSRVRTETGWLSCSVTHAGDRAQLEKELRLRQPGEFPILLQERIVGPGMGIFVCYDRGKLLAIFSHRRLREKPPWGGVSVLSESVPVSPIARKYTELLLEDLHWHGAGMVEFKVDARDGQPKLMEINGRFWGSLQLAIDAGVDFPAILLETLEHRAPATPPSYKIGVKSRWFWGDVDSMLLGLRSPAKRPALPNGHGRLRTVVDVLTFWGRDLHYDNPKFSDPKPWLYETARWFKW